MVRKIRIFDDPILRREAKEVAAIDEKILSLISDMKETMKECEALGLAANQVGEEVSLFLLRNLLSQNEDFIVVINPRIRREEGEAEREEGCLSLPGIEEVIKRPKLVVVEGMDEKGKENLYEFSGILARAAKHEIDHLQGKLFIDYLSPLRLRFIEKRLEELKNREKENRE
jgi:peptide deformylase|uniref:Peptide deformylase n=1 Tax=candidate division WOR-3 bacterium TaxID=2052148 RepID=A0A7C3Z0X5_UNCW3